MSNLKSIAAAAAAADEAALLRDDVRTALAQLVDQVRLLRALASTQQSVGIGFLTAETRERLDAQVRADRLERRSYAPQPLGLHWLNSPESISGTGNVRAGATIPAVSADAHIALVLHHLVRVVTHRAWKAGTCVLRALPADPDTGDLAAHLHDAIELEHDRRHLNTILREIERLEAQADEVVNGTSRSYHDQPCPHCGRRSLVIHHRLDLIRCDKDMRTGRLETCTCDDPFCRCHQLDPATRQPGRHEWHRTHLTAPSLRDTWSALSNLLTIARELTAMETKALDAVERAAALHTPHWGSADGTTHTYVAYVTGTELEALAPDHQCTDTGPNRCHPDDDPAQAEHAVPACITCGGIDDNGQPAPVIYPCATATALDLDHTTQETP